VELEKVAFASSAALSSSPAAGLSGGDRAGYAGHHWIATFVILIREVSSADPLWASFESRQRVSQSPLETSQVTVAKYSLRRRETPSQTGAISVLADPIVHRLRGVPPAAHPYAAVNADSVPLRYGSSYCVRMRLMDLSRGRPTVTDDAINQGPRPSAPFRSSQPVGHSCCPARAKSSCVPSRRPDQQLLFWGSNMGAFAIFRGRNGWHVSVPERNPLFDRPRQL
jgi:hypothetical protein